ncbi:MAG: tetratricopeptide repeat protein [Spirochaetales bacterium]|nr:tetratricopeptide repeat protein [Spirochaetales bacterium]
MSSHIPTIKQTHVVAIVVQIIILILLMLGFSQINSYYIVFITTGLFVVLVIILKYRIPHYHRKGISFIKKGKWEEALFCFEQSYIFFKTYGWIDRYRFFTLLSASKTSFTEEALLNKAFCLARLGRTEESIQTYKKVLGDFPHNGLAKNALRMMVTRD